jgi:hypothetical protein
LIYNLISKMGEEKMGEEEIGEEEIGELEMGEEETEFVEQLRIILIYIYIYIYIYNHVRYLAAAGTTHGCRKSLLISNTSNPKHS